MCFVNYEDIMLVADSYVHLDCTEDCITDRHGMERYCPYWLRLYQLSLSVCHVAIMHKILL